MVEKASLCCRKWHCLALALCLALLAQLGAPIDAENSAKMLFPPSPATVRRHYHPIGGRLPLQHGHGNVREETNAVAAPAIQPSSQHQQQSYAVTIPQAPPHAAFDYGSAKPTASGTFSYSAGADSPQPPSPGYEDGAKDDHQRHKNGTQTAAASNNAKAQQDNTIAQNALEQRRAKRRCPREAAFLESIPLNGSGLHTSTAAPARTIPHRVAGSSATGTEFSSGPQSRIGGERLHAAEQYAAPMKPISVSKSKGLIGPEYEQSALPPAIKPSRARTKAQPAASVPSNVRTSSSNGAAGLCNTQPCNNGDHTWAYIKKPKKQGGSSRNGARKTQAVTPAAPAGTALGGVGKYFTALPLGVKGFHYQTINSKNLPTLSEAHRYYYPPRVPLPLPTCFHNPTGYPCCNPTLNDLIVETYTDLESKPKFHTCNINAIAQHLQLRAEERFNTSFETVAAFDDFAQKIHFYSDLVCKVELGGKYMLAYATVKDVDRVLSKEQPEPNSPPEQQPQNTNAGTNNVGARSGAAYPAIALREKRENTMPFVGSLLPSASAAMHELQQQHHYNTMWI